jgi:superfamily II DNA or RNA helicase
MLRDYQIDLFKKTQSAFAQGHRRPLVVAPCGAGKSYLFAEMVRKTRGEALVLTHRQELKEQHEALFQKLGIENARVAMILTEANRLGQYPTPALVVADEAHLSRSNSWMRVIEHYNTWTVGLTATPIRLDGRPMGDVFDDLIEGVDVKWLIKNGNLAPYEYYAPTLIETEGLRTVAGDYVVSDLEKLMNERAVYGNVIESYRRFAPGERTICYCVSVEHARATAGAFNAAGISAEFLSAATPAKQRRRILEDFRGGVFQILCNVGIISEGVSIDEVTCCMLLRPTESVALGIQQMMRCMRYLPGKTAKIIDCVANFSRIGLPDDGREWSLGEPLKRKPRLDGNGDFYIRCCPECFMTFKTADVCPFCGHTYPLHPREIKAREEIELKRITAEEMARVEAEKRRARMEVGQCKTIADLRKIQQERGYAPGWIWRMARLKNIQK